MDRWGAPTLSVVCLGVLLVLTGCLANPFIWASGQERPVRVLVNNSANVTQTFEVWAVKLPANVTVRRDDGVTATGEVSQGLSGHNSGEYHVFTAVELPDSAYLHGRYTLSPGEQNQSVIEAGVLSRESPEKFPPSFAVVVIISQDRNRIVEWVSANCAEQTLVGLEVHTRPSKYGDAWAGYECR